jgi:hypothetical protein
MTGSTETVGVDGGVTETPSIEDLAGIDLGGIVPHSIRPCGWMREKPIYRIEDTAGRRFVLKSISRADRNSVRRRVAFAKEVASYSALQMYAGRFVSIPKLVSHGPAHLLIEHVTTSGSAIAAVRARGVDGFAKAVAEFHWDAPPGPLRPVGELIHRMSYSAEADAIHTACAPVRRQLGIGIANRCAQMVVTCRKQQPVLDRSFVSHNDLWSANVLPDVGGQKYHLIDFASRSVERRWVFDDVVRFGFLTRDMNLARELMHAYSVEIARRGIEGVVAGPQIRFALLRISMRMLSWKREFRDAVTAFITTVLLDDYKFDHWLETWESPFVDRA